jgi:hypothetical protein
VELVPGIARLLVAAFSVAGVGLTADSSLALSALSRGCERLEMTNSMGSGFMGNGRVIQGAV